MSTVGAVCDRASFLKENPRINVLPGFPQKTRGHRPRLQRRNPVGNDHKQYAAAFRCDARRKQ